MCSLLACAGVTPILRVYGAHVPCVRIRGGGRCLPSWGWGERGGGSKAGSLLGSWEGIGRHSAGAAWRSYLGTGPVEFAGVRAGGSVVGDGGRRVGCGVEVVVGGRGSAFGVERGCDKQNCGACGGWQWVCGVGYALNWDALCLRAAERPGHRWRLLVRQGQEGVEAHARPAGTCVPRAPIPLPRRSWLTVWLQRGYGVVFPPPLPLFTRRPF